ncbi:MAG: GH116 family glycosyl-hydrolase [Ginsengibacter sp.]
MNIVKVYLVMCFVLLPLRKSFSQQVSPEYPVLKHYDQDHLAKIAMGIGGIGTGTISIGGRGDLRYCEIMNRPGIEDPTSINKNDLGSIAPVFCLYTRTGNGPSISKSLIGPLETYEYEHEIGTPVKNHGLPRFRHASFDAAYPFGQVHLSDENMPLDVTIKAFNPLVPGDADASGIPIAVLHFVLTNKTSKTVSASICGVMDNFIGINGEKLKTDGIGELRSYGAKDNINEFRNENGLSGIFMYSDSVDKKDEAWGTIALSTPNCNRISYKTSVSALDLNSGTGILSFWDDFSDDGMLVNKQYNQPDKPTAALASYIEIPPNDFREVTFYITWHFPNRYGWSDTIVGNYYTTRYADAWDVIKKTYPVIPVLESRTLSFVHAFLISDLPEPVKEAALFNVSTLRSETVFRSADGKMFGWEGVFNREGAGFGSCTHVWNYEQATAFLFGDLAKTMRDVEFEYSTDSSGKMSFRTSLPLTKARGFPFAAADGQMGAIMKMYREWQLSGDDNFLKIRWPAIKKALSFAWIPHGWDSDSDGVMEGCQHNTMDVEYYGPNPQMQLWYLGALKAAETMANYLGDKRYAAKCTRIFSAGSKWTDKNLFNGEYYVQDIRPPGKIENINPALVVGMGSSNFSNPEFQLGNGCLVDQLVGQFMAHICGLGYLVDSAHVRTTLKSIMQYNYRPELFDHFSNLRSFAMDGESGLLMAEYPSGRPTFPFPYFNEIMTGFEYVAAIGMLYEDQTDEGMLCIKNIRDRFDGRKRNPFDEIEWGHHYARAMASWGAVLAISGFQYSGVTKEMSFREQPGTWFWSNGYSWGTVNVTENSNDYKVNLEVLKGGLRLMNFKLGGKNKAFKKELTIIEGTSTNFYIKK